MKTRYHAAPRAGSRFLQEIHVANAAAAAPAATSGGATLDPLDLYGVRATLTDEERMVQDSVGASGR